MAMVGFEESSAGHGVQDASCLQVDITVIRADNVPSLKTRFGKERRFYIAVTDGVKDVKSKLVYSQGQSVIWNEKICGFHLQSPELRLSLYAEYHLRKDKIVGSVNIKTEPKPIEASYSMTSDMAPDLSVVLMVETSDLIQAANDVVSDTEKMFMGLHVLDEWKGVVDGVLWVMDVVGDLAQIHPCAQVVWTAISSVPKVLIAQFEHDENIRTLVRAMRSAFDLSQARVVWGELNPNSNQALILKVMLRHIGICNEVIKRYAEDKEFVKRLMRNIVGGIALEVQDLCNTLQNLRRELVDNATISTQIAVARIQESINILPKQIDSMNIDIKLDELPYKSGWRKISGIDKHGCLPGTRVDFLDYITNWVNDPAVSKASLVLFGQAGTGKSTIAHELALRFRLEDRLGSYFSFSRNETSKFEDYHLFTTIIHDLAKRYPAFKAAVGELINDDKALRVSDNFHLLFNTLVLGPLKEVDTGIPILIIIDALDECANPFGRTGLAAFLAQFLGRLPKNVRVIITSRLDGDIKSWFTDVGKETFGVLNINDPNLSKTEADIRLFFEDPLNLSPALFRDYGDILVKKSEGLFQWAAVASRHIRDPPAGWTEHDCLRGLLNRTEDDNEYKHELNKPLYKLYDTVLSGYFHTGIARRRFKSVMGQILATTEPVSLVSLNLLRRFMPSPDEGAVLAIVKHLGSLLSNVTSDDQDLPIAPLHTSFRDYLTMDPEKANNFFVDVKRSHVELAHACIDLMVHELKFNICSIKSSYLLNSEITGRESQIHRYILPGLIYASRYWGNHLAHVSFTDDEILDKLHLFFRNKFLYWLEVLSVTDNVPSSLKAFELLDHWICSCLSRKATGSKYAVLRDLITDAHRFLRYFSVPIAQSAPHIYVSALPFAPRSSKIYQLYRPLFQNIVKLALGRQALWPALEMDICVPTGGKLLRARVLSVAFSPDSQFIATAVVNYSDSVSLWSALTGKMIGHPLPGQSDVVVFSPDGRLLATSPGQSEVCVWNSSTKELQLPPLKATYGITSIAFSPDSKWIVAGLFVGTVMLWNVVTGKLERRYTDRRLGWVTSVAFSPHENIIASGSRREKRVYIWDAFTGQLMHAMEHTGGVESVVFSPDGRRIASGSEDETIVLWNVLTGAMESGPMTGHTDAVLAVAFSPDGSLIASGSADTTIRVWNANTGELQNIFQGHRGAIHAITFSRDGKRIVSGSEDGTFCQWNVSIKTSADIDDSTFPAIHHVSFSPDGKNISSKTSDGSINLWDSSTGQHVAGLFRAPTEDKKSNWHSTPAIFLSDETSMWVVASRLSKRSDIYKVKSYTSTKSNQSEFFLKCDYMRCFTVSSDGQRAVGVDNDQTIRVWNMSTGALIGGVFTQRFNLYDVTISPIELSPDGNILALGFTHGAIGLWNVLTGKFHHSTLLAKHTGSISSISFSPNGKLICSGSLDRTLCLCDVLTGRLLQGPLTGHTGHVLTTAFSPDGTWIASGSQDLTIRIWNVSTGEPVYVLSTGHIADIKSISFSPDGQQIASAGEDGTIRIFSAHTSDTASGEVVFDDFSVVESDGWIRGERGELLLWIPSVHRAGLYRPNVPILIIGQEQTRLDTSRFVHGSNWAECYTNRQ